MMNSEKLREVILKALASTELDPFRFHEVMSQDVISLLTESVARAIETEEKQRKQC